MTKTDLIEVLNLYFEPFYHLVGAFIAVVVIFAAVWVVLNAFFRWRR